MIEIFDAWIESVIAIARDNVISFYLYMTLVLSEIGLLWAFFSSIALPFTALLVASIINIIVWSLAKMCFLYTSTESFCSLGYIICGVIIFIIGFFFNWIANLILIPVPLLITFLVIQLIKLQYKNEDADLLAGVYRIVDVLISKPIKILSKLIILLGPIALLTISVCLNHIPIIFKISILILYAFCIPFVAALENDDIFEIFTQSYEYSDVDF